MELKEIAKKEDQKLEPKTGVVASIGDELKKPVETAKVDVESEFYQMMKSVTKSTTDRIEKLLSDDLIWANPEKSRVAAECIDIIGRSLNDYKSTLTNIYFVDKMNFKLS